MTRSGFEAMAFALVVLWGVGCANDVATFGQTTSGAGGEAAAGGQGGSAGAGGPESCAEDCAALPGIPACYRGVCNTAHDPPMCTIQTSSPGTACDEGGFCTLGDYCQDGTCMPGATQNDCGQQGDQCNAVACNEQTDSCMLTPKPVGTICTSADLCQVSAQCNSAGQCAGVLNNCQWTPVDVCQVAVCDPQDGQCKTELSPPGTACDIDLCNLGGTCDANATCTGTTLKDCTYLSQNCQQGVCDLPTGNCTPVPQQPGTPCVTGVDQCHVGMCDANHDCIPQPKPNGTPCDDYNSCTASDVCTGGVCAGIPNGSCSTYLVQSFDGACPPPGWTLTGEWKCGTPTVVGPASAFSPPNCIATVIDGNYSNNDDWIGNTATTPTIDLSTAVAAQATWRMWIHTEGSVFDGANLKVSTDGGSSWQIVSTVVPAYTLTVNGESAWGGNQSALGWQPFTADLSAYAGHYIRLRFAFRSDGSIVYPGVYIDDVIVTG
jgi:hypothetical protein